MTITALLLTSEAAIASTLSVRAYPGFNWDYFRGDLGFCTIGGLINTCIAPAQRYAVDIPAPYTCRASGGPQVSGDMYLLGCTNVGNCAFLSGDSFDWTKICYPPDPTCEAHILSKVPLSWNNSDGGQIADMTTSSVYPQGYKIVFRSDDPLKFSGLCDNAPFNPVPVAGGIPGGNDVGQHHKIYWDGTSDASYAFYTPDLSQPPITISGQVYVDDQIPLNCSLDGGETAGSTSFTLDQTYPASCIQTFNQTSATGSFNFPALNCFGADLKASFVLHGSYSDPNYEFDTCNPGEGNNNSIDIYFNDVPVGTDIYRELGLRQELTTSPWLQLADGGLFVNQNVNIDVSTTSASPYLITNNYPNSYDIAVGTNLVNPALVNLSVSGWNDFRPGSPYTYNPHMAFGYNEINDMIESSQVDYNLSGAISLSSLQGDTNGDGIIIYFINGTLTISADLLNVNQKYVIISKGSIQIDHDITLGNNGFLLMTTPVNIDVDTNLGNSDLSLTTPNLEGLFIAGTSFSTGGNLTPPTPDIRINIKGAVISGTEGAGNYSSQRNLRSDNVDYPSDYLQFNPKLILNFPDLLKTSFVGSWQELR